jgi:hypothetical protein
MAFRTSGTRVSGVKSAVRAERRRRTITLRCRASSAPGLDWEAIVRFVPTGDEVQVWETADADEAKPVLAASLPGPLDPRALVALLIRGDDGRCLGGDFLDEARVSGLTGLWAELLVFAWCHEGEPDTSVVAGALLSLDNVRLRRLRRRLGPFNRNVGERISRVLGQADKAGLDGMSFAALLARAAPDDDVDLHTLEDALPAWMREHDQEVEAVRQARLAPFRADIERLLAGTESWHPRGDGQAERETRERHRTWVRSYLEHYVVEHGAFPHGVHRVHAPVSSSIPGLKIDFDDLWTRAREGNGGPP